MTARKRPEAVRWGMPRAQDTAWNAVAVLAHRPDPAVSHRYWPGSRAGRGVPVTAPGIDTAMSTTPEVGPISAPMVAVLEGVWSQIRAWRP